MWSKEARLGWVRALVSWYDADVSLMEWVIPKLGVFQPSEGSGAEYRAGSL
jgi:hypothetical protein